MQVIWKKTGRIKPASFPRYIGHRLYDVYGSYSQEKSNAYEYCIDILREDIGIENVISYGITSKNPFQFTFEAVFKYENLRYVLVVTKSYDKVYILEDDSEELYKRLDEIAERVKNVH